MKMGTSYTRTPPKQISKPRSTEEQDVPCDALVPEQEDEYWSSISIPMDVIGALLESLPDTL